MPKPLTLSIGTQNAEAGTHSAVEQDQSELGRKSEPAGISESHVNETSSTVADNAASQPGESLAEICEKLKRHEETLRDLIIEVRLLYQNLWEREKQRLERNFSHGGTCEWLIGGLQEQRRLQSLTLDKRPAATSGEDPDYIQDHWAEHPWHQKLKDARKKRSETQKEAADRFRVSAETYRKWEASRTPHTRYISAIFGYIRDDGRCGFNRVCTNTRCTVEGE